MHSSEELLQVMCAAAFLRDSVKGGTQSFYASAIGDVVISRVEPVDLSIQHQRSARDGHIDHAAVFSPALGLKRDALAAGQGFRHPLRFSQALRRDDQTLQKLPND